MMLKLSIFIAVILMVVAHCQANHTKAQERVLHKVFDECGEDLGIPPSKNYFERGYLGGLQAGDPKAAPYIHCVMVRMEFVDCAGTIGKKALVDFFTDGHDVSSLPGVVDDCDAAKKGNNDVERSFDFYHCFFQQKKFII